MRVLMIGKGREIGSKEWKNERLLIWRMKGQEGREGGREGGKGGR